MYSTEKEIASAILDYLTARNKFLKVAKSYPSELMGNDNLVGRIGEFLALQYLRAKGRRPIKSKSKTQKGFDLMAGKTRISVKVLTYENEFGRGVRLKEPWDEFILINLLSADLRYVIGIIHKQEFHKARRHNPHWSRAPIVKKTMLGDKGLFGKYGLVEREKQYPHL